MLSQVTSAALVCNILSQIDEFLFLNEQTTKTISIPIIQEDSYEKNVIFYFQLGKHF